MRLRSALLATLALLWLAGPALAAGPSTDFRPDPRSVRRNGPAYRYPQAGWIVLHIEGEPYDRGYQHGQLLAAEIAAFVRCYAAVQNSKAPTEGWKTTRTLVNAILLRRFEKEYLEEMKGIADGASAAGARFDNRALDLVDIAAINSWAELETLDAALEATPTGLEGIRFKHGQPKQMPPAKPMHCSAFAATGPATADGKIVFAHCTMVDLYPGLFFNIWLDLKPARGHRILMQTYPGGIQSGLDYYMNDAGLLVSETTIAQTRFDIKGTSLASRIRQAVQYADSIDRAVELLQKGNNGLYTNEWMLGDTKTNEIAMFELGTTRSKLYRSGRADWFGGTEGFYWGCNNAKDLDVRLDTIASVKGKPANMVWKPTDRDRTWLRLYQKHKGKIGVDFAKEAYATAPLVSAITVDAKFTTTDLAKDLKSWALFGPPLGKPWAPSDDDKTKYPEIRTMVGNPWAILHATAPAREKVSGPAVVDLPDKLDTPEGSAGKDGDKPQTILRTEDRSATLPAWHGTVLPKDDADIWLATAFADYEKIVAVESALRKQATDEKLSPGDRDRLGIELFTHRTNYFFGARSGADTPLAKTRRALAQDDWYQVASGKGVLLLAELRQLVGPAKFEELMESFGKEHGGKAVTTAQFRSHMEKAAGQKLQGFFDRWLGQPGLAALKLGNVQVTTAPQASGKTLATVTGVIQRGELPSGSIEITLETEKGEVTERVMLSGGEAKFKIETTDKPRRVVVDKYAAAARSNGGVYSVLTFTNELQDALIVYGTADEVATNREAAEALQEAIRSRWSNLVVPIKTDKEVKDDDLKNRHILLIGRPDSNRLIERFRTALPIAFGSRSFTARSEAYAHACSGVIAAAENPLNRRYSLVVLAGLSGESTLQMPAVLMKKDQQAAEVLVVPNGGKAKALVIPAKDLVHELIKD
jgi:hypothetical protein